MNEKRKISFLEKVAYGCGAGGGNVMSTLMSSFLLSYYTDDVLLNAGAVATMFLLCRFLDGITDITMGGIVDKTKTKIGKARPWIIICSPLMLIGLVLIVSVPHNWTQTQQMVYAYVTYIFLNCVVYTIFGIAHSALLARMTRDNKERNTTSVVSSIWVNLAGIIAGTMITYLYLSVGWTMTGLVLGIIAGVMILITGLFTKEAVGMDEEGKQEETIPMKDQLPAVLKNKYFYLALIIGALTLLMNANAIASQIYYCNVVVGNPAFMAQLMSIGQIPGLVVLLIMPWFSNKFSKRNFMLVGCAILIASFVVLGFAGTNETLLLVGAMMRSVGVGPIFAGIYALIADACDFGEWRFGIRSEGLMSASQSIGSKIGIGFGSALTGWILAAAGYTGDGAMTDGIISAIKFDYTWLGAIISIALFIAIALMNVEKYIPQIREAQEKKEAQGA
jgi:GPH family glycoside/pentoside/hexuronide:cation symporter